MTILKFSKDKEGLKGVLKFWAGRLRIVGVVLYFSPNVTVRTDTGKNDIFKATTENVITQSPVEEKSTATTILFKNNEFDYAELLV
jgi:phospho-N-acetylmuramoyl-pentapeptide-transferase